MPLQQPFPHPRAILVMLQCSLILNMSPGCRLRTGLPCLRLCCVVRLYLLMPHSVCVCCAALNSVRFPSHLGVPQPSYSQFRQ
jgi:hypothetical protein